MSAQLANSNATYLSQPHAGTDDIVMENHLLSICVALGGRESGGGTSGSGHYVMGDEVLECLRDLKRFLRQTLSATSSTTASPLLLERLGAWNVLPNDLLPILLTCSGGITPGVTSSGSAKATTHLPENHAKSLPSPEKLEKIAFAVVEVLVPLTWPVDRKKQTLTNSQRFSMLKYKESFLSPGILGALTKIILNPLSIHYKDRKTRQHAIIRLVLVLFRNLLAIPDPIITQQASMEIRRLTTLQEELVVAMQREGVLHFLMSVAASIYEEEFADWNTLLQEIFYLAFLGRDPNDILGMRNQQSKLGALLAKEKAAKTADLVVPTRHGRFGGTITLDLGNGSLHNIQNVSKGLGASLEANLDLNKKSKRTKRMTAPTLDETAKVSKIVKESSRRVFRQFAHDFMENCFNYLVLSVKRDFDFEKTSITEPDYLRFLWLLRFGLEYRSLQSSNISKSPKSTVASQAATEIEETALDLETVTSILNIRGILFVVRRINLYQEEKRWVELHVAIDCFKRILHTLQEMSAMPADHTDAEAFHQASEVMQHNLFYEGATIDLMVKMVKFVKFTQLGYLKSLVEMVHVLLKMLYDYSKSKPIMFRRKQRGSGASKKKSLATDMPGAEEKEENQIIDDADEEDEETRRAKFVELAFKFETIETLFANETVIATYFEFLSHYTELEDVHFKAVAVMFHRIFVRCKMEALFYRMSMLELFNRLIANVSKIPEGPGVKELLKFIDYALGKFFIRAKAYPLLFIECFFPKNKGDCLRIQYGDGFENQFLKTATSASIPATSSAMVDSEDEVEVKPGLPWSDQVGVAVGLIISSAQTPFLEYLQDKMEEIGNTRAEEEDEDDDDGQERRHREEFGEPGKPVKGTRMDGHEEQINLMRRHKHIRLLLTLFSFVCHEGEWVVPTKITREDLFANSLLITHFMEAPLSSVHKMVRKKRKAKSELAKATKEPKEKKSYKAAMEKKHLLSAQFIEDSDDDVEADALFFQREAERRQRNIQSFGALIPASTNVQVEDALDDADRLEFAELAILEVGPSYEGDGSSTEGEIDSSSNEDSDDDVDEADEKKGDVDANAIVDPFDTSLVMMQDSSQSKKNARPSRKVELRASQPAKRWSTDNREAIDSLPAKIGEPVLDNVNDSVMGQVAVVNEQQQQEVKRRRVLLVVDSDSD